MKNPVHLVLYFRFMRFFPNGTLIYRTSPQSPVTVMPTMLNYQRYLTHKFNYDGINISHGRYLLEVCTLPPRPSCPNFVLIILQTIPLVSLYTPLSSTCLIGG